MSAFLVSIGVFVGSHLILPIPAIRNRLIGVLGRRAYLFVYSLLSIGLIIWVVAEARQAPFVALWRQQPWNALVPLLLVPIAAWFLIAGLSQPNPLSISFRAGTNSAAGPIVRITRHPVLWAFFLWAASHVVANGDRVSLILFGGLGIFAIVGFKLVDLRSRRRLGDERWAELSASTSIIPFAAVLTGRTQLAWTWQMTASAVAAAIATIWFVFEGHLRLIGADPLLQF